MTTLAVAELQSEVMGEMLKLAPLLARATATGLRRRRLTQARLRLLLALYDSGSLSMTDLSRALDVTPRNVTGLVDRLEADGLVRRAAHPTDRRMTVVELTARGRRMGEDLRASYRRFAADLLQPFGPSDLAATGRVLGQVCVE